MSKRRCTYSRARLQRLMLLAIVVLRMICLPTANAQTTSASKSGLPRGSLIYVAPLKGLDPEFGDTLAIFSLSTPTLTTKILRRPQPGDVRVSSVSAEGKKVAFFWISPANDYSSEHQHLRVIDVSKGTETTVFHGYPAKTSWSPDGRVLWVGPLTDDDESLFLDLENRRMWRWKPTASKASASHGEVWLSLKDALFTLDGILGTESADTGDGDGYPPTRRKAFVLFHWKKPAQVINSNGDNGLRNYAIAPDLSLIADIDEAGILAVRPLGGGEAKEIKFPFQNFHYPTWSPDSQWVAMASSSKGATTLIAVNVASGKRLTLAHVAPSEPGALWVAAKPVPKSATLEEIEAALGPGEPLHLLWTAGAKACRTHVTGRSTRRLDLALGR